MIFCANGCPAMQEDRCILGEEEFGKREPGCRRSLATVARTLKAMEAAEKVINARAQKAQAQAEAALHHAANSGPPAPRKLEPGEDPCRIRHPIV